MIVTGGAQGIGRAYCERLGQEGASVLVADMTPPERKRRRRSLARYKRT